ncbi:alpha/beta-hydrolase [Irpex rosettiformis]|uniref:Alpha/beta-hydrolase n=1 Tax=Irpex rosettiformis TaxID=378272 RepID=A0ACB8UI37_9APHY|nr:alpha/beta-hydrolase [Irpex rosettiformis]
MSTDSDSDHPTIFDTTTCIRKGLCPVSSIRNKDDPLESHSLYFEQHGTGPEKIIFIMGLNSSSFAWEWQVEYFPQIADYSVLVFDNRGVGNSGAPRGPYTTSGMAEDAIALLNYVGWTEHRDLHVVGVSLGGMIAQELASRIPERIISLTLGVTTAGGWPWSNLPPWKGLSTLARLTFISDPEVKIPMILEMAFPVEWLDSKAEDDTQGRTNREIITVVYRRRIQLTRPQKFVGHVSQMVAGLTHYVSPDRLRQISKNIPKILILTGDDDHLVRPSGSVHLKEHMPEAEFVQWEKTGHAIHMQHVKRFNGLLERVFAEGKQHAPSSD